ncbi:uncharacterized protein ACA1_137640 [Acanthamoeba castellanii str. Neff]|uniref:Uncharacterized protein n=1 Tax=Acanthamoeba castellanii (strain ATCC 30010 / Neff) TaxID=1257118 RepID=L8GZJ2_ACACF|nr:uncharacterized protein ACA1_137640 [Acanthamoeba castellanii str. Neff]ELR18392.1 hypothetical protein ACA1_137640 [Acanthamoeba castellanii str. Neff]
MVHLLCARGFGIFVFPDVRFENEALVFDDERRLIRLEAPKRHFERANAEAKGDPELTWKIMGHTSETALDQYSERHELTLNMILDDITNTLRYMKA